MCRKFTSFLFFLWLYIICFNSIAFADDSWTYKIIEETTPNIIDIKNSNIDIDYEKREIRIPKMPLPNTSDFNSGGSYDYVILQQRGMTQYLFNGSNMIEVGALSIEIENPLGVALSPNDYSVTITRANESDASKSDLISYRLENNHMIENPALNISGMEQIYSLTTFNSSGDLLILKEEILEYYAYDENNLINIPNMTVEGIKDPIAVAANNQYSFAILEKDALKWYEYDGTDMVQIPAMSLAFGDTGVDIKKPKTTVVQNDTVFILDDDKVKAYKYSPGTEKLEEHVALSISEGLIKPSTMVLREGTSDLLIVDEIDSATKEFKLRYFMFDGTRMVENEQLSKTILNVMGGLRYYSEGTLISSMKISTAAYADLFRIRAYTEVPLDTEITFYVTNEGEDVENVDWHKSWRIINTTGTPVVEKSIINNLGEKEWTEFGNIDLSYPTFDSKIDNDDYNYEQDEIEVVETEDGLIIVIDEDKQLLDLWTYIPIEDIESAKAKGTHNKLRFKAVLKTNNPEITPKIFVPIGTNNEQGLIDPTETAFIWEANAKPLPPIIDPIDPDDGENEGSEPTKDELKPIKEPGWIYTTTPTITWQFNDADNEVHPEHKQMAFQLFVLHKNSDGFWGVAYNSSLISNELGGETEFKIPTSYDPEVAGPLWLRDSYEFAIGVRTWDSLGAVSDIEVIEPFKILAFERLRIVNVVYPPKNAYINAPVIDDLSTHYMITPDMKFDNLPSVKAGTAVTLAIDSIGPIKTLPKNIARIYYVDEDGEEVLLDKGTSNAVNELGLNSNHNRWYLTFWTKAPITIVPDNTLVQTRIAGEGEIGGVTVFYIPNFAEGIVKTKDTVYQDWQVILQGSD